MIYLRDVTVNFITQQEGGKGTSSVFSMEFHGKPADASTNSPCEVFNEWVASELARVLGLPVLDTCGVQDDDGDFIASVL